MESMHDNGAIPDIADASNAILWLCGGVLTSNPGSSEYLCGAGCNSRNAVIREPWRSPRGRVSLTGKSGEVADGRKLTSSPAAKLLLPAGDAAHIGQMVRNALVAIDAGLFAGEQEALMRDRCARRLLGDIHRLGAVAVAAFQRIVGLEARPFVQRQFEPMIDEFLAGIDGAEQMCPRLPWKPASCVRSCRSNHAARGSRDSSRARRSDWRNGWWISARRRHCRASHGSRCRTSPCW